MVSANLIRGVSIGLGRFLWHLKKGHLRTSFSG
jgi:hypothetical protein